jgi:hypothetical protein
MKKEKDDMGTLADDDINERINAGRQTIEMSSEDMEDPYAWRVPPGVIAAGVGVALVGLGVIGWMVYRSRRRRTLVEQIQAALPERLRDLRELGDVRMRDLRDVRDDLMERLKKVV